jgi:hypothetical protein
MFQISRTPDGQFVAHSPVPLEVIGAVLRHALEAEATARQAHEMEQWQNRQDAHLARPEASQCTCMGHFLARARSAEAAVSTGTVDAGTVTVAVGADGVAELLISAAE